MSELYLPSWVAEADRKRRERARQLAVGGGRTFKVRDGQKDIGWVDLGMEFTCIPDSVNPWTPEVLKAIWVFDPTVVPLWIRWKFRRYDTENSDVVVFGRHGIGRHVDNPHHPLIPFNCEMPNMPCQGVTFKRPNLFEYMLIKNDSPDDAARGSRHHSLAT